MEESDYVELIYQIVQDSARYGIGNCTQTTRRITEKLATGKISDDKEWKPFLYHQIRDRFPGSETGRRIQFDGGQTGSELLMKLNTYLGEGQHCQVSASMKGKLKEKLGIGHVFNAMKLEGKVRIIDTYKGWSRKSWLNQSWNSPEVFLKLFF